MNLQDKVLMQLRDLILRGEFLPGTRLAEQQLASRLNASRDTSVGRLASQPRLHQPRHHLF